MRVHGVIYQLRPVDFKRKRIYSYRWDIICVIQDWFVWFGGVNFGVCFSSHACVDV